MAKRYPKIEKAAKSAPKNIPSVPSLSTPNWFTNARLQAWAIFVLGFLLYANTFGHDYAQDDAIVITQNMLTTNGLQGIPGILQYDTFYGYFKEEGKETLVAGGRYRPLSLILFAIEYQFFGQNPFVGHLMNALFYGLTGFVLYWLLLQLVRPKQDPTKAYFIAIATSLLFITHPIHTEAVANIKGRDEILALLGSLAALYFSFRAFQEKKNGLNILAGIVFFLALLSKENAITFVVVTPLTFYFFTKAKTNQILVQTLPFIVAAALFLVLRTSIIGFGGGNPPTELMNNPFLKLEGNQYVPFSAGERLATVLFTLGKYLQLLVFPHPLTHDYYPRQIDIMSFGDWQVLLSLFIYIGLGIYAIIGFRKKNPIAYGILFYLLTLSLVSNIVFQVGTNMAERLLFMPSVGFCIAISALAYHLTYKKKITSFGQLYLTLSVLLIIAMLFSIKTIARNPAWKSNFTLFTTDIQTSSNSAKLRNALGSELVTRSVDEKNEQQRSKMLNEAAGHLLEAIRIHPYYSNAYLYLGICYRFLGQYDQAIVYGQKAMDLDPEKATNELANTYFEAGRYYAQEKQEWQTAIGYLENAQQLRPNDFGTIQGLGVAYGNAGNLAKALEFFTKSVALNPNDADAWFNLGSAYYNAGQQDQANEYFQKAVAIEPGIMQRRQGQ
ncbi:MAG: tetratricopeptide repeat protein [Saprospiraceae bacterium]|nr:tetratricopeptide repeat protein [Saprospiraceae bacterium]